MQILLLSWKLNWVAHNLWMNSQNTNKFRQSSYCSQQIKKFRAVCESRKLHDSTLLSSKKLTQRLLLSRICYLFLASLRSQACYINYSRTEMYSEISGFKTYIIILKHVLLKLSKLSMNWKVAVYLTLSGVYTFFQQHCAQSGSTRAAHRASSSCR